VNDTVTSPRRDVHRADRATFQVSEALAVDRTSV